MNPEAPYVAAVALNNEVLWKTLAKGEQFFGYTAGVRAQGGFVVFNPGTEDLCVAVRVGSVAWEKGLK